MDELRKIKAAIIYGQEPIDGQIRDGKLEILWMDEENDGPHISYFMEYLQTHYQNDAILQQTRLSTPVNGVMFELTKRSNVVFANTTSYCKGKDISKTGVFLFPKSLSSNQEQTISLFGGGYLEDYKNISIWYDFRVLEDGIISYRNLEGPFQQGFDNYLAIKEIKKQK